MAKNDPLIDRRDVFAAMALLSRWPVPLSHDTMARGAHSAWAWPLVGVALSGLAALVAATALWLGLGPMVAGLLALSTLVVSTGALHEDGLADVADGFWGGFDRDRRLEIMKDSRIGAYGTIALILSLGLRASLLAALGGAMIPALLTSAALSRATMAGVMYAQPNARETGLSHRTGRPGPTTALTAAGLAALIALLVAGWAGVLASVIVAITAVLCALVARRKIGGQTGDTLGATQQITEITALIALTACLCPAQ